MNKSLNELGSEASKHYTRHELDATFLEQDKKSALTLVDIQQGEYDRNLQASAAFAKENAAQLHDLAVIEAHLGGVARKVEQPLSIGDTIEVNKS